MKPFTLAIVAGALSAMTAVAIAQTATTPAPATPAPTEAKAQKPPMRGMLGRLDANKDGVISADEFSAIPDLKAADTDGNGELSLDELSAMILKQQAERRAARMIQRLDVDGDGKVTLAEIEQHRAKQFSLMDRNDDGKLEGRELRRGDRDGRRFERHERRNEHGGKHWKRHGKPGDRHNGAPMPDRT